jgi:anaerobic magnesium-protoporphyrin IX monomethyl ester cyclase
MKICLVLYKYNNSIDDPCCYPLGFMYISSSLKQAGHDVKVLNYNLFDYQFVNEVKGYDVVLFTGFESFLYQIILHSEKCKELGIKTILGGALATFRREEMLKYVDTVVVGEGDSAVHKALTCKGILFGARSDINKLPFPDYEGFGIAEYNRRHKVRYTSILTSRGCPFSCTFCAQTCVYQERNLDNVFSEIDLYINKYNIELLTVVDNTLNTKKDRFLQFCTGMKERKLRWGSSIRCDNFDDDMASAVKDSYCDYLVVGVESFNQNKLDFMNKKVRTEQIINTLELLHKYNIKYHANILLGFENETYNDIQREVSLIPPKYNLIPAIVQPYIGTKNGRTRLISKYEEAYLSHLFKEYAENKNLVYMETI